MANKEEDYSVSDTICCDDGICLSCTAVIPGAGGREGHGNGERVCLAAEGFGNRTCFLQSMANKELPFEISVCVFELKQALSVRALQEMVSTKNPEAAGQSAGHRTLLYGHAVLLRHSHSNMYLSCLNTQSSITDKLAFDVGLTVNTEGESCWWTIHPASKQRSEGEKVRVGDDLILVSVASERYLHIGAGGLVIASFQQTLWTVQPVSSGVIRQKSVGFVFGGDVLRLFHGDECLAIPARDVESGQRVEDDCESVMYETGAVQSHARSLWKLEHIKTKWAEGFMGWNQVCRLRHVTSGRYLAATADNQVVTFHRSQATEDATAFIVRQSKDDRKFSESNEDEGMGTKDIKYGDSPFYLQHMKSGMWVSYQTFETKKRGVGRVEEKKAILMVEGHMDDAFTMSRAQEEENKSARVIRKCTSLISKFVKALESLKTEGRTSRLWEDISLAEVIKTLEDLIDYFAPPANELNFEVRQIRLKALRNRQDLFQEEGMIALILETIDKCSQWKSMRHLAHLIGEDSAAIWNDMINYLYLLLAALLKGNRTNCSIFATSKRLDWLVSKLEDSASTAALIQGNHRNCTQFASSKHIDWLVRRLEGQESSKGVLDVLHCVLIDSPEALNVIKEQHIRTIISLIDKHGRDPKVLDVLCSLCVGNGVAVRSNQNLIMENLMPGRDLLLQTRVIDYIYSMRPNIYVGRFEGSAIYQKWYYEAIIDHIEMVSHLAPLVRIGWASCEGFIPYPGGGQNWGANGVGDDLFSYGFDGVNLWTGSKPKTVRTTQQSFQKGDIIGVCLDLGVPQISFTVNGIPVKGFFKEFNLGGMFHPVISVSAKVSVRFMLGGEHGRLKYGPPEGHSPVSESLMPKQRLKIEPCFNLGNMPRGLVCGPAEALENPAFIPRPVDTSHIQLPGYVENVKEKLAENLHELWAMSKIENGWCWGERRDDAEKIHPCIVQFERLSGTEKQYNVSLAEETLKMLLALDYHLTYDPQYTSNHRLKSMKLPNQYTQPNGYRPSPLDLSAITLNERCQELVELLAENTHNVWAKERIKQGWTYGLTEDFYNKRSHHLVPYSKVDEIIKASNRQTASETVRTLMAYGYNLEAPTNELAETVTREAAATKQATRTYRAELTYAVDSGKWYYEFEVITPGNMRVGWAKMSIDPSKEPGQEGKSYLFDGYTGSKWHQGREAYGKIWQKGDVIGVMLDSIDKTICFSLNGELMMDRMGQEIAFKGIDLSEAYVPIVNVGAGQHAKVNFGQNVHTLKYFTCCGLQEGYEPFCVNMTRPMPLWYIKESAKFEQITKDNPRLEIVRVPGGSTSPPCLKVHSKTFGTVDKVQQEYLRITLPVKFHDQFIPAREKQLMLERRMNALNAEHQMAMRHDDGHERRGPGGLFKKKPLNTRMMRSVDDSGVVNGPQGGKGFMGGGLRRQTSDTNLAGQGADYRRAGPKTLMDKFSDVSKALSSGAMNPLSDRQRHQSGGVGQMIGGRRGKSPFNVFKKGSKSRDASPMRVEDLHQGPGGTLPVHMTQSSSEYSVESDLDSLGPSININHHVRGGVGGVGGVGGMGARLKKKRDSQSSYTSEMMDTEADYRELEMNLDIIDEYYYGVRIFPGQDTSQVYIGWVTPQFNVFRASFDMKDVRNVMVCSLDMDNQLKSSISRKNVYIVSAGDLQNRYSQTEEAGKRAAPGLLIGCHCNVSTGLLSFTVNGQEAANKFQVEPGAMLFPAIFFEPTNKEVLQMELGRTKSALPLSSILFRGGKSIHPQCPPRLDFQALKNYQWSRVPISGNMVHVLKLSDIRGWSMLCEDAVHMMALHIPEENRCLDIFELIENPELLKFHSHTLQLYGAVCSHGNHRAAHELTRYVDDRQLMFCIKSKYMPGPLRMGLHNLLISLHLDSLAESRLYTQKEYIIPLGFNSGNFELFNRNFPAKQNASVREGIPSLEESVSIRPKINIEEYKARAMNNEQTWLDPPYFPLDILKQHMMDLLTEAVKTGAAHIRDPIGGTNENLFVPLLRVVDKLFVIGLLDDKDFNQLLCLIDPINFDTGSKQAERDPDEWAEAALYETGPTKKYGLLQIKLSEPVKLEFCTLLHHVCDNQLRHRIESLIAFSEKFVGDCQSEQKRRYNEIKQTEMPMAVAAKRTREFRCPPQEQMRSLLSFKDCEIDDQSQCPVGHDLRANLLDFHSELRRHCNHHAPDEEETTDQDSACKTGCNELSWGDRILSLLYKKKAPPPLNNNNLPENIQKLIINTIVEWAKSEIITDQRLIRAMFSLLHRQYDGVAEVMRALDKAYVISIRSVEDIINLLTCLGLVRSLIMVQTDPDEEELLKQNIWDLANNKVFFQHPDLMRQLGIHETVMQLMVNTLNKAQQQSAASETDIAAAQKRLSEASQLPPESATTEPPKDQSADMVVACCRFLCYFCRTGRVNQRAMFEHLSYLLDNSCMLLSRPSLRGSCPLDVAYSSLMDNNELALALRESDLDKVTVYLSRCGQQSNQKLVSAGYPDLGWDPVEGERFVDFLRFCVWVNGESVEENANLVVRLLIRRPECLGPALRGEGGGLLKAMRSSIMMSLQIAACRNPSLYQTLRAVTESEDDERGDYLHQTTYDFSTLPQEEDDDYIDYGAARLQFYSSLVDLLGRCAPEQEAIKAGRSDSLRARAILRSLVSLEDLEGTLGIRFILPTGKPDQEGEGVEDMDGDSPMGGGGGIPQGLLPQHKASVELFLERVYDVDQATFYRLLENAFLPDLRAATSLEETNRGDSDLALALNRYLCNQVLPLLTNNCGFFRDAEHAGHLLEQTLHTCYKMSKCRSLTKLQRDTVSDFLVALTGELRPSMMTSLLRKLVVDVPALNENTITPLRVLVNHYERCGRYYGVGWGSKGSATEEEKRLTMMLFSGIFDSLAQRDYDPELFSKALPCLSAIGCALPPDYSLSNQGDGYYQKCVAEAEWSYNPQPVDISSVSLSAQLQAIVQDFAEHYHDSWAMTKIDAGWVYGPEYDETKKYHPNLRSFQQLTHFDKSRDLIPTEECLKTMLAYGWTVELDQTRAVTKAQIKRKTSKLSLGDYTPKPADLRNVTLTRGILESAEKLAENAHDGWAMRKKQQLEMLGEGLHPQLIQYSALTEKEKKILRDRTQEIMRYLQMCGYRIITNEGTRTRKDGAVRQSKEAGGEGGVSSSQETRFAYSLLEKLLEYLDKAAYNMKNTKPASRFSRRHSFSIATEDVKFFGKVVLPLMEKYFRAHKAYFITNVQSSTSTATIKEKEMTASLFAKLALLLRQKITAFGHDVRITVRCLQTLVTAIDARAIVKSSPEIVRSSLLPFFTFAADDLTQIVANLKVGRFSHVKGTITRGATSLNYVHMVLIPVLTSTFDHLGRNGFGADLLVGEQQLCCYKILNALYTLGTSSSTFVQRESIMDELARHRSALGECVASFASTMPVAFLEPQYNKYNKNSIVFGIEEDRIATHSLEAKEVMDEVARNVPTLEKIVSEIEGLAESGGKYHEAPHVIEVTLPMLCSYLPCWWLHGSDVIPADISLSPSAEPRRPVSTVTAALMNNVLGNVLKLIQNNIGAPNAPWMNRIATRTQPIIVNATAEMLKTNMLPVALKLREQALNMEREEEEYVAEVRKLQHRKEGGEVESDIQEHYQILVRDMYAFYPLLIKYVDLHRSTWLKNISCDAELLYLCVADVFNLSSKSHMFKKEEQNFVFANEIDNMALIMPSQEKGSVSTTGPPSASDGVRIEKSKGKKRQPKKMETSASLNVACLKRLLPIGLNMFGGREQELVQQAKQKLVDYYSNPDHADAAHRDVESDILDFLKANYQTKEKEKKEDDEGHEWQKSLYKKISNRSPESNELSSEMVVCRILAMGKVLFGLHLVEHPHSALSMAWKKLVSSQRKRAIMSCFRMIPVYNIVRALIEWERMRGDQKLHIASKGPVDHPMGDMEQQWRRAVSLQRKRAVMACFRMVPVYNLSRHRAINLFLKAYKELWLSSEPPGHGRLVEDITVQGGTGTETEIESEEGGEKEGQEGPPLPLRQLITAFSRSATTEQIATLEADFLYISYAVIMSQSCHGEEEEEEEGGGEEEGGAGASIQEQEMEKQKLLYEQSRLSDRGVAEMVLMYISASKGQWSDMVIATIDLGISILMGGNTTVQKKMLNHLREKKDVGFFTSVAGLMQQCSVLDLDAFERNNKAEGLGVTEGGAQAKNLQDTELTCKLFRFLQLLCEGHNLEFQNYLRTQAGNTTTVNIVICTVDYLLRLQESIMDFYWHYVSKDRIDDSGKESFIRAISVASQIFNSISEYIQGPCAGNQLALAHSRLWDAVGGFLFIFAHMQEKLSKDPEQLELLREFMTLQKDMMIMLLSMLEDDDYVSDIPAAGEKLIQQVTHSLQEVIPCCNVVNGPIGKQMVDTLVESSANFEMILKFFDIFLKMKGLTTSEAFMELDVNKDGVISPKEFRLAMVQQKVYSEEEIEYVMMCVDANQDGKVDFNEFTDRFHDPAKDIGFNVAVLLTNLSEHIPFDPRLQRFIEKAQSVLSYFEPYLGRIEIMGGAGRIERVYFEIKQSNIDQWEAPQIKESKRAFLHNMINEEGEKGKLECFVNFCEDTIFEESKRAFLHSLVSDEVSGGKFESFTNFCEDAIFEMQHATSISAEEQQLKMQQYAAAKSATEGEKAGLWELTKMGAGYTKRGIKSVLSCLSPSYIKECLSDLRSKSIAELLLGFFRFHFRLFITILTFLFMIVWTFFKFIYVMMRGEQYAPPKPPSADKAKVKVKNVPQKMMASMLPDDSHLNAPVDAFGFGFASAPPPVINEVPPTAGVNDPRTATTQQPNLTQQQANGTKQLLTPSNGLDKTSQELRTSSQNMTRPDGVSAGVPGATGDVSSTDGRTDITNVDKVNGTAQNLTTDRLKPKPTPNGSTQHISDPSQSQHVSEEVEGEAGLVEGQGLQRQTSGGATEESLIAARVEGVGGEAAKEKAEVEGISFWVIISSMFARNFYTFKVVALALAFCINFLLLFFRVTKVGGESEGEEGGDDGAAEALTDAVSEGLTELLNATLGEGGDGEGDDGGDDDGLELVDMEDKVYYLSPVLRLLALLHTFAAFAMIIGYYSLKVPLVVFKREKEISRSLEFDGIWIAEQPSDDDIKGHWDKLVICTKSFPDKYWDKFVKKKVKNKYSEQYDPEQISCLLGMDSNDGGFGKPVKEEAAASMLPSFLANIDWRYEVWKWGIIFTDNAFLYIAFYFVFSLLGNFNYFFFAAHLMDVAVCIKTLGTILQSVTHNGKQLVLTVMLLSIVVYLYTVLAFNFFRKFYVQEEEGEEPDMKCHDMMSCYMFHLYVGVRAGGGIGDEINAPDGDPYEVWRILFDITFFFFVIVILLAIIQGLIIDAFGELRDQLEQVKEDLESSCFICGIGKDYFDKIPHGFEIHVKNEHNFANYMFFLMHLINKPDTEYTGQESYVWGLYQQRCWDFFPVGECFRKQYEEELTPR